MMIAIDKGPYDVIVTFRDGRQLGGRCEGDPFTYTPLEKFGIFSGPFLIISDTGVTKAETQEYVSGYKAMIRIEDVLMIQAKKVSE